MKTKYWLLCPCIGILIYSCTNTPEQADTTHTFKVMRPIIKDTVALKDYVADIQSVRHIEIRARLKGYIEKAHVDEGQSVKEGQLLFTLSSKEYREALTKARAAQKGAAAELKTAQVELENIKHLMEKKLVAKSELEIAEAKLITAEAKIEDANADEANALLNLSFAEIRAPFNGTINRIPKKAGSLIDEGELLTTLSDADAVFAYFYLSEKEHLDYISNESAKSKSEVELIRKVEKRSRINTCKW
jgi:RND family efflux transporter MFP subunit